MSALLSYLMSRGKEGSTWTAVGAGILITYFNLPEEAVTGLFASATETVGYIALLAGVLTGDKAEA